MALIRSSIINEVIKSVSNFLLFFYEKILQVQKSTKPLTANKNLTKKAYKKHLREKKSLIRLFVFCAFAWLCFYAFSTVNAFSACKIFS